MPSKTKKNTKNKNRLNELRRIQKQATRKQRFEVVPPKLKVPGQKVELYSSKLQNNFPGQMLKEFDPNEYIRQKQKLQVMKNMRTLKYNRRRPVRLLSPAPLKEANRFNLLLELEKERQE
jgi:hypothetical protein